MTACIGFEDRLDGIEDRLDGISNYLQWKVRMLVVIKENKIRNYANSVVVVPAANPVALDLHEVKEAKA